MLTLKDLRKLKRVPLAALNGVERMVRTVPTHFADLIVQANTGELSLTASTARTVILWTAPTNQRLKLRAIEIMGKSGSSSDTPCKVELLVAASITGGTSGSLANTPKPTDGDHGESVQGGYLTYTAEPTYNTSTVVRVWEFQPQTGFIYAFPTGLEVKYKGGTVGAIRLTPGGQAETVTTNILMEE